MGAAVAAGGLTTTVAAAAALHPSPPATTNNQTVAASQTSRPSPRRINGSSPPQKQRQPSVAEVQRAIGVATDPFLTRTGNASSPPPPSTPFLDSVASTPIGQAESPAETKLREAAEWVVDRTEARASSGQQILMVVCLKILPVWLLLLLVASGVIKLPFNLPFMDDLIT